MEQVQILPLKPDIAQSALTMAWCTSFQPDRATTARRLRIVGQGRQIASVSSVALEIARFLVTRL
ncbi:hypothetical protein X738_28795 [Mesorhizobium sp. LNHC209A00]|nr:hypothetical protein X738_28795 [Mesorhizobium sp. LNHC209A00]